MYDESCIKSDVCNMAVCDGQQCKHRFSVKEFREYIKEQMLVNQADIDLARDSQIRLKAYNFILGKLDRMENPIDPEKD
jgi:hypothetical protein